MRRHADAPRSTTALTELDNDRWMAINDVPGRARAWLKEQPRDFRTDLDAFAAGINAYVAAHPDAWSPEARRVLPVSATDVIAHAQRVFLFVYAAPARSVDQFRPMPRCRRCMSRPAAMAGRLRRAGRRAGMRCCS